MAETREIDLGKVHVGSVERLRFTLKKKNSAGTFVAWSGIDSVTITFENPDRTTQTDHVCILEDDTSGIWYYDTTTTDVTSVGYWTVGINIVDGGIDYKYPYEVSFEAVSHP